MQNYLLFIWYCDCVLCVSIHNSLILELPQGIFIMKGHLVLLMQISDKKKLYKMLVCGGLSGEPWKSRSCRIWPLKSLTEDEDVWNPPPSHTHTAAVCWNSSQWLWGDRQLLVSTGDEEKRNMAGEDSVVQSTLPLRPFCCLLLNSAMIRGEGFAENGFKWRYREEKELGLCGQSVQQPRPYNLIPIIGLPEEL